jgi:HNH endonuclease
MDCPYCAKPIQEHSDDHIFSAFLGGKRTIATCKSCNSTFGSTFEGRASKKLQELQVSIKSWGLPMKTGSNVWKGAHEFGALNTLKFDLYADGHKTELSLTGPVKTLEDDGKTTAILFGSMGEAERAIKNAQAKGKSASLEMEKFEVPFGGAKFVIALGRDEKLLSLKMACALATLLKDYSANQIDMARKKFWSNDSLTTCNADFWAYPTLISLRPSLAHMIYVERRSSGVFAIVQLFGVVQLRMLLGENENSAAPAAIYAYLDPITGDEVVIESFLQPNILLTPPPSASDYDRGVRRWLGMFRQAAIDRGAAKPPSLSGDLSVSVA